MSNSNAESSWNKLLKDCKITLIDKSENIEYTGIFDHIVFNSYLNCNWIEWNFNDNRRILTSYAFKVKWIDIDGIEHER